MSVVTVLENPHQIKSSQDHIDDIYALFDETGHGAVLWEKLDKNTRACFCKFAELKQHHIDLPLHKYNELERHQLLKSIKRIEQLTKQFSLLTLSDFK